MVSFPYYSHTFRDSCGSGMGIVWETYHKGVPLLGVPGITLEKSLVVLIHFMVLLMAEIRITSWDV